MKLLEPEFASIGQMGEALSSLASKPVSRMMESVEGGIETAKGEVQRRKRSVISSGAKAGRDK